MGCSSSLLELAGAVSKLVSMANLCVYSNTHEMRHLVRNGQQTWAQSPEMVSASEFVVAVVG